MSLLDEVGAWLAASPQSQGTLDSTIFLARLPDDPLVGEPVVALYVTPGAPAEETLASEGYLVQRFQVVVRSNNYPAAATKCFGIRALLTAIANRTISGRHYLRVRALQSEPFPLGGPDENNRWRLACNFEAWRSPT